MHESLLLDEGIELGEFKPGIGFIRGLNLLICHTEDESYTAVPVRRKVYHHWDLYRRHDGAGYAGMQFWLSYNPHLLLSAPK